MPGFTQRNSQNFQEINLKSKQANAQKETFQQVYIHVFIYVEYDYINIHAPHSSTLA